MSELKRLRITSNGDLSGTKVIDTATGKALPTVSVDWHAGWQDDERGLAVHPIAKVEVLFTEVDVETGAEVYTLCPACREAGGIEELLWLRDENRKLKDQVTRLERDRQ